MSCEIKSAFAKKLTRVNIYRNYMKVISTIFTIAQKAFKLFLRSRFFRSHVESMKASVK